MDEVQKTAEEVAEEARQQRLADARAKKEERERKEKRDHEDRFIEAEELAASLEPTLGERGKKFGIVNNRAGVFAIKKPDTKARRIIDAASLKDRGDTDWNLALLKQYIVPVERSIEWARAANEFAGLVWQTSNVFMDLLSLEREDDAKKL